MFRKWIVSVVAATFLAVGFWGCEETPEVKKESKKTESSKTVVKGTMVTSETKKEEKTVTPTGTETKKEETTKKEEVKTDK